MHKLGNLVLCRYFDTPKVIKSILKEICVNTVKFIKISLTFFMDTLVKREPIYSSPTVQCL